MNIQGIELENFLSFGDKQTLEFSKDSEIHNYNVIVGPNNSGKTNVLRALYLINRSFTAETVEPMDVSPYYFNGNIDKGFKIEIKIKLDKGEIEALAMFMTASLIQDNIIPLQGEDHQRLTTLHKIFLANAKDLLEDIFSKLNSIVMEGLAGQAVPLNRYFTLNFGDNKVLYITGYGTILVQPYQTSSTRLVSFGDFFLGKLRKIKPELLTKDTDLSEAESVILKIIKELGSDWFYELFTTKTGGLLSSMNIHNIGDVMRMPNQGLPETAAILRLRSLMSSLGMNTDLNNLNLTSLIGRIYNAAVIALENPRSPPSGNLPEDLDSIRLFNITNGSDIARILYLLKNSSSYLDRNRFALIQARFKDLTSHSFDIGLIANHETTYEKKFIPQQHTGMNSIVRPLPSFEFIGISNEAIEKKLYEPKIYITSESFSTALDFAGAGMLEAVLLSYLAEGVQNKVVIIDEPASNLHLSMQIKVLKWLKESGPKNKNQFIIITHSQHFVDVGMIKDETLWIIRQKTGISQVANLGGLLNVAVDKEVADKKIIEKLYIELSKRPEAINLLFSQGAVLVEGPSDEVVAKMVNEHLKATDSKNAINEEWTILSLNGKGNLKKYLLLVMSVSNSYCIVVDKDALMERQNSVILTLKELGLLSKEELDVLHDAEKDVKEGFYSDSNFNTLRKLAESHRCFVLRGDLEDALGIPYAEKGKPKKAMQKVTEILESDSISTYSELNELNNFIATSIKTD